MRLLIADSGATKTDWAYIQNGKPVFIKTSGLHPAYLDEEEVMRELGQTLAGMTPDLILFYGAGCYSDAASLPVRQLMERLFGRIPVDVYDDLTAVAHAFLGKENGIAGILGTGSNSGLFLGGRKSRQVPPLGYVLGDEGSAADIGKRILRAALREEFSESAIHYLGSRLESLEYSVVIRELYHARRPSYYLAGVSEAVLGGDYPEEVARLIEQSCQSYVESHLKKYDGFPDIRVVLSGGIAVHQREVVAGVLERNGVRDYAISGGVIAALARRRSEDISEGYNK